MLGIKIPWTVLRFGKEGLRGLLHGSVRVH